MEMEPIPVDWEAIIRLRPSSYPVIQVIDEKGGKIERTIAPEELVRLLSESQIDVNSWNESPILPENCYRYTENTTHNAYKVLLKIPPQNHDTWLFDQRIEGMAYPSLMFGFVVMGNRVKEKYVVALLKDDLVTDETPVYFYPYSNVYEDAKACWHELPEIVELRQLGTLPELFFASPDTMELLHGQKRNSSGLEYREFLTKYQGKSFPTEFLVPRKETVGDFWKRL